MQYQKRYIFDKYDHDERIVIEKEIEQILIQIKRKWLHTILSYMVHEIATNASKANMKRAFFKKNNLNIEAPSDYEKGIKNFKTEINENTGEYFDLVQKTGYKIQIEIDVTDKQIFFGFTNSCGLLPIEIERINDKYNQAKDFGGLDEALMASLDNTEGAGLGLTLMILMIRKIGLDQSAIQFSSEKDQTFFSLRIPVTLLDEEEQTIISDAIVKEIQSIPQFPEHIIQLQKLLSDPNADFKNISNLIIKDPALIADLLKTVNSASYGLTKKIAGINEAVKILGMKGLRNLIAAYAAGNILMSQYKLKDFEEIMRHSSEVASYAYFCSLLLGFKVPGDILYIGSILHDIGKILVYAVMDPKLTVKIKEFVSAKGSNITIAENLIQGYNHSLIGAKLAAKWGFPDELVEIIQNHHNPFEAKKENQDLVILVYLANILYYYKRNQFSFSDMNFSVLKKINKLKKEDWDQFAQDVYNKASENK